MTISYTSTIQIRVLYLLDEYSMKIFGKLIYSLSLEPVEDVRDNMYQVPIIARELIGILNKRPYSGTHNEKPVKTHIKRIDITFARTGMLPVSM